MKTVPFAFLCPLTGGQNQHLGQGQTKLILKTKRKKIRNPLGLEMGQDEKASESMTADLLQATHPGHRHPKQPSTSPHISADGAQNSLQKTPKHLHKRLLSEQSQVKILCVCIKGRIFVRARSPGRIPGALFILLISRRAVSGEQKSETFTIYLFQL